ncbi:MAG: ABC transporter ATP-binding protein [Gammaproteobacteria bacterium]|nr:ABC transporter ATP-binding protein [Gammaproteobacteria bacterium]
MAIELKDVCKIVGVDTHIHDTSLKLEEGRFNILLGTTLSGKTTLLRLMAGLEPPSRGEIWFKERNVTGVAVQKRNVAMVYQQFINYPNFSVYDNIASPLKVLGIASQEIKERVRRVADLLQITPMLARMPSELSGGQQQRTALARALIKESDLILLDEPLANLDYKLREELREELPKLFAQSGATVVYATTEPAEALLLGGYTATLHEGRVTQYGPTAQVYREPRDLLSARVFSDPPINTASITKRGDRFHYNGATSWPVTARLAGLADGPYTIGFRPHHITLEHANTEAISVRGKVVVTEISGSESVIHMHIGSDTWVSLSHGIHPLRRGDEVELFLQTDHCFYFDADERLIP